jgi:hypothetical protein
VKTAQLRSTSDLLLLAPVRGLATEVPPLLAQLTAFAPDAIGAGLSADELASLQQYFVRADAEPIVPLTTNELNEVRGLARFGEVRVPNPVYVELLRWADERSIAIEPLDPSEDRTARLFTEHIGYVELVRRTVKERSVGRNPPTPSTPDEFALAWDREVAGGRGSRDFARARDRHLARRARRLGTGTSRFAVIVDRERFDLVRSLLAGEVDEPLAED